MKFVLKKVARGANMLLSMLLLMWRVQATLQIQFIRSQAAMRNALYCNKRDQEYVKM